MNQQTEISTERLILKAVTPLLIHDLFNTKSKEEICRFFGTDEAGYEHFKAMHEGGMETHRLSLLFFLLIDKQTGVPIGECGFHTWNRTHNRAEIFYNMRNDEHKQKGYMTEALKAVLEYGFAQLGLHRVEALVDSLNTPSVKLLLRYGFVKEGTMREDYCVDGKNEDSDCYSLLKWEWQRGNGGMK